MEFDKKRIIEVLQREIAITRAIDQRPILATTNVAMCTVFYGRDTKSKVGFLCHLDLPFTTNIIPSLLEKLRQHSGPNSTFASTLCCGNRYSWARSPLMREKIRSLSREWEKRYSVKIEFGTPEEPYTPIFRKRAFTFNTENGVIGKYPQRTTNLALSSFIKMSPAKFVYETALRPATDSVP